MDKLSLDASQALAAHMSYGRWKAMQDSIQSKKKDVVPEGWIVCENCGKAFKPKTKREQRFCEYICQRRAYVKNNREKLNAVKRECMKRKRQRSMENG